MIDLDNMDDVVAVLRASLKTLPGSPAQEPMSPMPRRGDTAEKIPEDARPSAALLLLFPRGRVPHLVLTKRAHTVEHHKGQISMPGGMVEPGESLVDAALREAREEIGVDSDTVTVLGPLSPLYIPISGFVLHPFVGTLPGEVPWEPAENEVETVLTPALRDFGNPKNHRTERRALSGWEGQVPYFALHEEKVWGATAMVLSEFLALLGTIPGLDGRE